ncbi:hypothetical protein IHE44_0009244 [Lamprotornis superbus]|uniref:ERO1-like protein beta n=1 Tax=Lamprotornis superbus TaxID=245042 RepID=A0A835TZ81_9PASS|nr:hypothetical protein IHE44_0009244 [Lamprotornis superbus]
MKSIPEYSKAANNSKELEDCEQANKLGAVNSTLSNQSKEAFIDWARYDDSQDHFCELDDERSPDAQYVDLLLNPERYTGYKGPSAWRVWNSIYEENCFKPRSVYRPLNPLAPSRETWGKPRWGPNVKEFTRRFDPAETKGEGPRRLKNLYFLYLIELRALSKVAPYFERAVVDLYTGNGHEDAESKALLLDIFRDTKSFHMHFDEKSMFAGDKKGAKSLKEEFRLHFKNISRIMDCVGCDKCRLWGKLQVQFILRRVSDTEEIHNQGSRQEFPDEKDHSKHYVTCISQLTFQICLLKSKRVKFPKTGKFSLYSLNSTQFVRPTDMGNMTHYHELSTVKHHEDYRSTSPRHPQEPELVPSGTHSNTQSILSTVSCAPGLADALLTNWSCTGKLDFDQGHMSAGLASCSRHYSGIEEIKNPVSAPLQVSWNMSSLHENLDRLSQQRPSLPYTWMLWMSYCMFTLVCLCWDLSKLSAHT